LQALTFHRGRREEKNKEYLNGPQQKSRKKKKRENSQVETLAKQFSRKTFQNDPARKTKKILNPPGRTIGAGIRGKNAQRASGCILLT